MFSKNFASIIQVMTWHSLFCIFFTFNIIVINVFFKCQSFQQSGFIELVYRMFNILASGEMKILLEMMVNMKLILFPPFCCIILIQFWWKFGVTCSFSPKLPEKTLFLYPAFSQYLHTNHLFSYRRWKAISLWMEIDQIETFLCNNWEVLSREGWQKSEYFPCSYSLILSVILLLEQGETNFIRWWVKVQSR